MDGARSTHDLEANPEQRRPNVDPMCKRDGDNNNTNNKNPVV
jgi:hypothetical protein